jgi:hypothetical protein
MDKTNSRNLTYVVKSKKGNAESKTNFKNVNICPRESLRVRHP